MAAYVVDFEICFYSSRVINNVNSPEEAKEYAEKLLDDESFCRELADEVFNGELLPENVETTTYCKVTNPYEWGHLETITKE